MKMKIKRLIAFVMLSGASLTILFALGNTQPALPNTQPNANPQTAPPVTVPGMVSTSGGNGGMHTRADTVLPSARYGSHIDLNQASVTLDQLDIRSVTLTAPNQIGVNRSIAVSPKTRGQKFVNSDGSQIIVLIIKSSGASGIGVHFRNFKLARGEEVYVYGPRPRASFVVRTRAKDLGAAENFGLALLMATRPLSSSIRELVKTEKHSRFLKYRTFSPS
jgi:hypothetical protein